MKSNINRILLALALAGSTWACGSKTTSGGGTAGKDGSGDAAGSGAGEDGTAGDGTEAGTSGGKAGTGGVAGEGGGGGGTGSIEPTACPEVADRKEVLVDSEIDKDTKWTCDNLYILTDLIFITNDAKLSIGPGTVVLGDMGSALLSTRGAQLISKGEKDAPVVFTSSAPDGSRASGDWGGVVMLGAAPINIDAGENRIEGVDPADDRGLYGGTSATGSCGTLTYTRIEFAGFELSIGNELNGLTLGGCGSATKVSHVQVHRGFDDGIEIFGGAPKLDHIVLTANADDQFDTDLGFSGSVQFLVAQCDADNVNSTDPQGFEWDNQVENNDALPRTSPTVYNATVIGTGETAGIQNGMILRRGTAGVMRNLIVTGFPASAVDVRDESTVHGTSGAKPALTIENSLFFENGADGKTHFPVEPTDGSADDDDVGFVENDFFEGAPRSNVFDKDPKIGDAFSRTAPDFVPAATSPAAAGGATPPDDGFFDPKATYMGAFEPGGDDWTAGWTAYPNK